MEKINKIINDEISVLDFLNEENIKLDFKFKIETNPTTFISLHKKKQ